MSVSSFDLEEKALDSVELGRLGALSTSWRSLSSKAEIEGEQGIFYGDVNELGLPCGEGVFNADNGWLICCGVKNGTFTDGKRVSVHIKTKELQLDTIKRLPDGTLRQKVELISL